MTVILFRIQIRLKGRIYKVLALRTLATTLKLPGAPIMSHKLQFRKFLFLKQNSSRGSWSQPLSYPAAKVSRHRQTCSHVIGPLNDITAENLGQRERRTENWHVGWTAWLASATQMPDIEPLRSKFLVHLKNSEVLLHLCGSKTT